MFSFVKQLRELLCSEMVRHQEVSRAWSFFHAVQRAGLVSHYQFNLMLALCTSRTTIMELVGQMEEANIAWDAVTYTSLHAALVRCAEHQDAVAVLRRGRDCGLVDDDAASIAATGALKDIMQKSAPRIERAEAAQDYTKDLRVAGLADAFHFCFLLRHCCTRKADLQRVVSELEEAQLPHSFHLYAALHRAYSRFQMDDEAAAALERLQHIFASLHATREAKIDEVCTSHSRTNFSFNYLLTNSTFELSSSNATLVTSLLKHCAPGVLYGTAV